MKKIIYTLLVAVLALSFMGCPTTYDDVEYDQFVPTVQYIMGDMAGTPAVMKVNGLVATYTFTYDETMTAWGGSAGLINFKVAAVADAAGLDWPNAWSDAALTINGDPVFTESKNGGNNSCMGLVVGEEYTITVTSGTTGVTMAISGKAEEATGPAADNTWPPVAVATGCYAVKVTGLSLADGDSVWNSNISWGGAKGSWAGYDKVVGTSGIKVNVKDGAAIMYISYDYAADGWAVGEAAEGTNFKLATGDGDDKWFKLEVPAAGYCELDWTTGK